MSYHDAYLHGHHCGEAGDMEGAYFSACTDPALNSAVWYEAQRLGHETALNEEPPAPAADVLETLARVFPALDIYPD